jgi:glucosamine-6-phosphate deaminase
MASLSSEDRAFRVGDLFVRVFPGQGELAAAAARELSGAIGDAVAARGSASIIVATGNSQLALMGALRDARDIEWDKVVVFHMDEYLGLPADHPASFRRYLHEHLCDTVHPQAFFEIRGDAPDEDAEMRRYTELLARHPADVCVMGIGENGHIAFNDPPADFDTRDIMRVVRMDTACRMQQVGEGHFRTIADVPERALTLTVPALLAPRRVLVITPEARKAAAVRAALEGQVTPQCPASVLQRQPQATLYLDRDSASLLHET